jgi:hypothetical protein
MFMQHNVRPELNAQKCSLNSATAKPELGRTRGLQEHGLFGDETPLLLMSDMAATKFVCILLPCRANQERQNPDILIAVTELPTGLFLF